MVSGTESEGAERRRKPNILNPVGYKNSISQPAWLNIAGSWQYRRHACFTPLPGASSAPQPCGTEPSLRRCRTDRDPRPSPPARGLAPAGQAPGLPAPGPRAARCGEQDPSQGALGRVPRSSRDAAGLAPVTRRAKVDEAASPARAPRDRSAGLQADPSDGEGEPSVGIPADQRRAGKLGIRASATSIAMLLRRS